MQEHLPLHIHQTTHMALAHILQQVISLVLLTIVSVSAAAAAASSSPVALPNCSDRCGNLTIPYPFGMGSGCSMNEWFSISCNTTSTAAPMAFLSHLKARVLDIDLREATLRIHTVSASWCPSGSFMNTSTIDLGDNPYLFYSEIRNRFSAFGCGVLATVRVNNEVIGGCMSICNVSSISRTEHGDDPYGVDCCQARIPHGLKNLSVGVRGTNEGSYQNCMYAFLVDNHWFHKTSFAVMPPPSSIPVVVDWKFSANETCKICGRNAICSSNQGFVSCSCAQGFEGNPYLTQGCTDVDECADQKLNLCVMKCTNMVGNYSCGCPPGYNGDGHRDGNGCVKIRSWVVPAFIGISAGVGFLLLVLGVFWVYKAVQKSKATKLKQKCFKRNGGLLLKKKLSSNEGSTSSVEKTRLFTSSELEIATDRFNENRILGRGGQGTVYKGMLADGTLVAVKKSQAIDKEQLEIFINEVVILSQIRHRNVVKLFGCCLETEVPLLVYEFIPNGTLSNVIHDQNEEFPLTWELRLRIAIEVSSAISYLHSAASVPIYHRDVKTANIILDDKFRAKLSDFGTSKSVALDKTHLTTQVKGTFGYFDPEYFRSSQFTEKSDVYSYGVVLVELLTGKKPICSIGSQEKISLAAYFVSLMEENPEEVLDILDAKVVKEDRKEELMAVAHLAKKCLELNGRNRPTMREVATELERIMISKGYLSNDGKKVPFVVKNKVKDQEYSSISIACFSDGCISFNSAKNVHPLLFNTE